MGAGKGHPLGCPIRSPSSLCILSLSTLSFPSLPPILGQIHFWCPYNGGQETLPRGRAFVSPLLGMLLPSAPCFPSSPLFHLPACTHCQDRAHTWSGWLHKAGPPPRPDCRLCSTLHCGCTGPRSRPPWHLRGTPASGRSEGQTSKRKRGCLLRGQTPVS